MLTTGSAGGRSERRGRWLFACLSLAASLLFSCASTPLDAQGEGVAGEAASGGTGSRGVPATGGTPATATGTGVDYRREDYPPGPYGTAVGAVIENFAFMGWRDPVAVGYDLNQVKPVRLSEFYDPTGATKLLWINASAVWCTVCRREMEDIKTNGIRASLGAKGLVMIETLFEDNDSNPARLSDLKAWGSAPSQAIDFALLLDPGFKLGAFFTADATPLNLLVDARTMRVIDATMGYSPDYWPQVETLLDK